MRLITAAVLFGTISVAVAGHGQSSSGKRPLTEKSHVDAIGTAHTATGEKSIVLRQIVTRVNADPRVESLIVLVLFDPETKVYSWRFFDTSLPDPQGNFVKNYGKTAFVFFNDGKFFNFQAFSGTRLDIHSFGAHATDIHDAAEKSLDAVDDHELAHLYEGGANGRWVFLRNLNNFTETPGHDNLGPPPTIKDVRWDAGHWIVTLKALWTEEITLDSDYKVVGMRKVE